MTETARVYLAIDLGASSGRVLAGLFDGSRLRLEEVHRFENGGVRAAGRIYWDVLRLWREIQNGLRAASAKFGDAIVSIGVDTWGVDFCLLGRNDELLGNPLHYRDPHTQGILEKAFGIVGREEIFEATGLQFMEFNTLYQLLAMKLQDSPLLNMADSFLMIPDLFHWLLTGQKSNEVTNASTTQFFNPQTGGWATELLDNFDLPAHILGELRQPGDVLGPLREGLAAELGLQGVQVVLPGTHDTASAVMAAPAASQAAARPDWCYISSGTWSLMGAETPQPKVNAKCLELNFTNEGGVGGSTRLLKNIAGLWLVQECRRTWRDQGHEYGWGELIRRASDSPPLQSLVNPDDARFTSPRSMPEALAAFCQETGQPAPQSEGAVIRCALESLALRYRMGLGWLEELVGGSLDTIHIIGGGTQNQLLNQMAADACNRRVAAGPVEATALGNVMMQAIAAGDIDSISDAREVIRNSFDVQTYEPKNPTLWSDAFDRFTKIAGA